MKSFSAAEIQKQTSERPLSELLHEHQDPFTLKEFLSERHNLILHKRVETKVKRGPGSLPKSNILAKVGASEHSFSLRLPLPESSIRSHGQAHCSPVRSPLKSPSRSAARLMEAAVRILEPGLHTCSRPTPRPSFASTHVPTTVRYLLELDHKANQTSKRSKRLRRASRKTQLGLNPCTEKEKEKESHAKTCSPTNEGHHLSSSAENSLNGWQKASEALISAFRLSPAKDPASSTNKRGGSLVQYSKLFSFTNNKKGSSREEESKRRQEQNNCTYSLLKSILRRLALAKESIKEASFQDNCNSEKGGSGMQNPDSTDNASVRFSKSMRSSSRRSEQENDQARVRICDIVRWNSFEESAFHDIYVGHSSNSLVGERCISVEHQRKSIGYAMVKPCLSSKSEKEGKKSKVTRKAGVEDWQAFIKRSQDASSDFSCSSSSSASLESSLDSDSLDLLSSSTGRSSNSDSRELKGIYPGISEESCSYGYFSLEIDENGKATDFHHCPRYEVNLPSTTTQLCYTDFDLHQGSAASHGTVKDDCMCRSSNLTDEKRRDEEENKRIPYMGNMISGIDSDECSQNDNCQASDTGIFEQAEQLSPVSVLDSPFEDTPGFEQSLATLYRAKRQLLKKISQYEQLAQMDPFDLEKRIASWKESSSEDEDEDESGSCRNEESERIYDISCHTSPSRSYQEEEETDWEEVETEEYVREVLSSQTNSEDLTSSTSTWCCSNSSLVEDGEMQALTGNNSYLKVKQAPLRQTNCKLLFDRVNEELQSTGKQYGSSGIILEPWLREQLVKRICGQISAWEEADTATHTDKLVELDFKREGEELKRFKEEQEEIGVDIELAILGVLVEEVLVDLVLV